MRRSGFTLVEGGIIAVIVLIIVALAWAAIAHSRGPHAGRIIGRSFHSSFTSFVTVGKTLVPIHHPESWSVAIVFGEETNDWDVDQATYLKAENGLWFDADTGRLTPEPVAEAQ